MKLNPCKCGGTAKTYHRDVWFTVQCVEMSCPRVVDMSSQKEAYRVWNFANPIKPKKRKAKR